MTRRADETRARILDAAFGVLNTHGLAGTTTKEIAAAADLTEGALYKHFPSKVALVEAVIVERIPPLSDIIPDTPTPSETLEQGLRQIITLGLTHMLQLGPLVLSLDADPDVRRAVGRTLARRHSTAHDTHNRLRGWIRQHNTPATIPAATADTMTYMVIGACQHYLTLARTSPADTPSPATFARRIAQSAAFLATTKPGARPADRTES